MDDLSRSRSGMHAADNKASTTPPYLPDPFAVNAYRHPEYSAFLNYTRRVWRFVNRPLTHNRYHDAIERTNLQHRWRDSGLNARVRQA